MADERDFKDENETESIPWAKLEQINLRLECIKQAVEMGSDNSKIVIERAMRFYNYITTGE